MTMVLGGGELAEHIRGAYPDAVDQFDERAVWVSPDSIRPVVSLLKEKPGLELGYLNAITAVDYVEYFEIVYHLTSFRHNHSAVVKSKVYGREAPTVASVVDIWPGADFQEREIWDLMGVSFSGHPNLKRLMMWEGFAGHPLRRDFKDTVEY